MELQYRHIVKKFGSSLGVIIPAENLKIEERLTNEKLKPGDIIEVTIRKLADGGKHGK